MFRLLVFTAYLLEGSRSTANDVHIPAQHRRRMHGHLDGVAYKHESNSEALMNHIFARYDKRIRPYADNGTAVRVHMTIVLGILIEMRENEQVTAYVISHIQRWHDPRLRWEPKLFNNTKELIVPNSMLWVPKIMDTKDMLTEDRYDIRLLYDGRLKINIPQYVTCICRLSIEQFPFDTQYCAVAFASPLLTIEEMDGNAEWNLMNVSVRHMSFLEEGEYRAEVHYIFQLRRRPIFYITVIVVPIFLISGLSILGIFTPSNDVGPRNEKVSLGLGSLLSMTVILGILASAMPKSNSVPLLGYYILAVIVLCAVAVGMSMAFLTLSRRLVQKCRVPSLLTYRMAMLPPKVFPVKRMPRQSIFRPSFSLAVHNGTNNAPSSNSSGSMKEPLLKQTQSLDTPDTPFHYNDLRKIYRMIKYLADEQRLAKKKAERRHLREMIEREWQRVFSRLDYVLLTVFEALNTVAILSFLQFAWIPPPAMREPLV